MTAIFSKISNTLIKIITFILEASSQFYKSCNIDIVVMVQMNVQVQGFFQHFSLNILMNEPKTMK